MRGSASSDAWKISSSGGGVRPEKKSTVAVCSAAVYGLRWKVRSSEKALESMKHLPAAGKPRARDAVVNRLQEVFKGHGQSEAKRAQIRPTA
eukprot:3927591-Prymnesium_polylepis.1